MANNNNIWADDKLGIQENVIGFANILKQEKFIEGGSSKVYAISAEFGIGKTFFCEKLAKVLEQDKVPVSILNIWEMDFYENPLIPLLIKIKDVYVKHNKVRTLTRKAAAKSTKLATKAAKIAVKYRYGINIDKFIKLYQSMKDTKSNLYNDYLDFEKELNELKDFLSSWAQRLSKPVIIIIDEIDRCRPDYAVRTLEVLKHFFDISGFVFVLAIDEEQLKSSVETLFGTKNFDGYKRKFINNSFLLPPPDKSKFTDFLYEKKGLNKIVKQIEDNEKDLVFKVNLHNYSNTLGMQAKEFNQNQTTEQIIKHYFTYYSDWFNFTLRHMEQVFDRLVLFAKHTLGNNELFSPDLAVFLVCLHEFDIEIYNRIKKQQYISDTRKSLFSCVSEIARNLYDIKFTKHFGVDNVQLLPNMPSITDFSTLGSSDNTTKIIHHNVDRFFKKLDKDTKKWIREEIVYGNKNLIDNNERLVIIKYSDDDKRWEGKQDFDNVTEFDIDKFKQNYFDKMNFISNFE